MGEGVGKGVGISFQALVLDDTIYVLLLLEKHLKV